MSKSCVRLFLALGSLLLLPGAALAIADLNIYVLNGNGPATVEITDPGGSSQTVRVSDQAVVEARMPGDYEVAVTLGSASQSSTVNVPATGQVNIVYDAAANTIAAELVIGVESIVVTARRFEETLQEVPVAISAFDDEELEEQRIAHIGQVSQATPNLWMETNTGLSSGGRAAIRGIGEDESFFTADTPVGIYIDDIYIPRQTGSQFSLYDVERIEVLRGPQGTLYGRNTSAGAIKLVTKQPGNQFRANASATIGEYDRTDFRGALNVPFASDNGAFLLSGMFNQRDGYETNLVTNQDVNDRDVNGIRAGVRFQPSQSVDVLVNVDRIDEQSGPSTPLGLVGQPPAGPNGFGIGPPNLDDQVDGDSDPRTLESDLENGRDDLEQQGAAATVTAQLVPNLLLKSVTSIREFDHDLFIDGDGQVGCFGLPLPCFHLAQLQSQEQWSQELQLQGTSGKLDWIAGVYAFHEENTQRTENVIFAPEGFNNFWNTSLDTDSLAAYANFTFHLRDNVNLTVGGRVTEDEKTFDTKVFRADGSELLTCAGPDGLRVSPTDRPCDATDPAGSTTVAVATNLNDTWSAFTPRVALDVAIKDNVLFYATVANGFKSGGFDGRANNGGSVLPLQPIAEEDVLLYEAGIKSDLADNRVRLNGTVFFNSFDDLQGTGTDPNGNFFRTSIGDLETKGLELEARWVPTRAVEFSGHYSYLDTEYTEVNFDQQIACGSVGTGDKDLELKFAPENTYRLAGVFTTPEVRAGGIWSLGASFVHKDSFWHTSCNALVGSEDGYDLLDGFLAYETANGSWRFALAMDNITDEEYLAGSITVTGLFFTTAYLNPPQRWSLTARYRF